VGLDEDQQARAPLGRAAVLSRRVERALLAGGVLALFLLGYFGVGHAVASGAARELRTPADDAIPFVSGTIWIYIALFPTAFAPLFLLRCQRLYRRTLATYAAVIAISLAVFVAFPVTSHALRVDAARLDPSRLSDWAVALVYRLDPPVNLFPSLHLSVAALAALSAWTARRAYGLVAAAGVVVIAASICTVKQHFIADGIAGLALAGAAFAVAKIGYVPTPDAPRAYGVRGPLAFAGLLAAVYAGFVIAFVLRG
jgi:hypothetical protein